MERIKIDKERTWVFSPVNNIVMKVDIRGDILEEQLITAIRNTVYQYEMFHQKIVLDIEGNSFYEKTDFFEPVIRTMELDWKEVVKEQEKIPFAIDHGEFVRFFYSKIETGMTILLIAHHIAGDGLSFTYLVEDILRALSGASIESKKLELYKMESLPKEARLRAPITWLMKYMNRKWEKTGKKFNFQDYYKMYDQCWENRDSRIHTYCVDEESFRSIQKSSKENHITINTMITTALIRASKELCDVGMAASIRNKNYKGMGNYATGISIKYQYKESLDFIENAKAVQKLIYEKLDHAPKKYFFLTFMGKMKPTLIDAVYFSACGNYKNKTAEMFSKMFGYSGNPKGISITNLRKLPIELKFGTYEISDFIFVPPLVLNAQRMIGVATIDKKMVLSLHISNDEQAEEHLRFFNQGMEYLIGI